jgi:MFS family permease
MIVIIGRQVLGLGPEALGGLISATGLGAILGLAYLLVAGHLRRQGRFIVACTFAYVAGLLLFALSHDYVLSFIALAITGLFDVLCTVTRNSVIQLTTPGRMRGRVIGTVRMVTGGVGQFSQLQSGLLTGVIGAPLAIFVAAGALALSAGSSAWAIPALWAFSREDQAPRAIPPEPTPGVT